MYITSLLHSSIIGKMNPEVNIHPLLKQKLGHFLYKITTDVNINFVRTAFISGEK